MYRATDAGFHLYIWDGSAWQVIDTPAGSILDGWWATAPFGYLLAYGQTVTNAETLYPELWAIAPASAKSGSDLTLPDTRGRVIAALDNLGGSDAGRLDWANTIGTAGGTQKHALTASEIPSHSHSVSNDGSHNHLIVGLPALVELGVNNFGGLTVSSGGNAAARQTTTMDAHNHTGATGASGSGSAHQTMQPTILMSKAIRV
jgi:microcystin-dependent protein